MTIATGPNVTKLYFNLLDAPANKLECLQTRRPWLQMLDQAKMFVQGKNSLAYFVIEVRATKLNNSDLYGCKNASF